MDTTTLRARPITAEDEKALEAKLEALAEETRKMPHVITIYPKGSRVVAWVMVDLRDYSKVSPEDQPVKKKRTRRKKAI